VMKAAEVSLPWAQRKGFQDGAGALAAVTLKLLLPSSPRYAKALMLCQRRKGAGLQIPI